MSITVEQLSFSYVEGRRILSDVTFGVEKGGTTAVVGPSGCGKSTLLRLLSGYLQKRGYEHSGRILIGGNIPTTALQDRGRLGLFLQQPPLLPFRNARENAIFPATCAGRKPASADVDDVLHRLGLFESALQLPARLSLGMRTRVVIASMLLLQPQYLLLDEPFAALDSMWRLDCYRLIADLRHKLGCTVFFVTHDVQEALLLADQVLVLSSDGRVLHALDVPDRDETTPWTLETLIERLGSLAAETRILLSTLSTARALPADLVRT